MTHFDQYTRFIVTPTHINGVRCVHSKHVVYDVLMRRADHHRPIIAGGTPLRCIARDLRTGNIAIVHRHQLKDYDGDIVRAANSLITAQNEAGS